jgi:hypothetical protein
MTTFTLRVSQVVAARLTSVQMRSWLDAFLQQPHTLPIDPGPGDGRISLTLSPSVVNAVATYSGCLPSSALRRIAIERLGAFEVAVASVPHAVNHRKTPVAGMGRAKGSSVPKDGTPGGQVLAGWLIHVFLWLLIVGGSMLFTSRKGKQSRA